MPSGCTRSTNSLGVGSIAIGFGFGFKDWLQSRLAGLLILIRPPFKRGDQIEIDNTGTAQAVDTRVTLVKTVSGRLVIIHSEACTLCGRGDDVAREGDVSVWSDAEAGPPCFTSAPGH
jgi:hypothetical protein